MGERELSGSRLPTRFNPPRRARHNVHAASRNVFGKISSNAIRLIIL